MREHFEENLGRLLAKGGGKGKPILVLRLPENEMRLRKLRVDLKRSVSKLQILARQPLAAVEISMADGADGAVECVAANYATTSLFSVIPDEWLGNEVGDVCVSDPKGRHGLTFVRRNVVVHVWVGDSEPESAVELAKIFDKAVLESAKLVPPADGVRYIYPPDLVESETESSRAEPPGSISDSTARCVDGLPADEPTRWGRVGSCLLAVLAIMAVSGWFLLRRRWNSQQRAVASRDRTLSSRKKREQA
jgi:hypothetical protein